uniref:Chromo domain-containing protein n=1 Tax=Panagrolaimus sp. JU765 TaxID=591449 RepID=A0AC34R251_9BILA
MAERAIRTLKSKLYKYFTDTGNHRWVDVLHEIVDGINNSVCRSTGYTPDSFSFSNASERRHKLIENIKLRYKQVFKLGDTVRVAKIKTPFKKGYLPNFSDHIYKIVEVLNTCPITYKLADESGQVERSKFYTHELCAVTQNVDTQYRIHVLKSRQRKGKKEFFVQWIGYDDSYNSWIPERDMISV